MKAFPLRHRFATPPLPQAGEDKILLARMRERWHAERVTERDFLS